VYEFTLLLDREPTEEETDRLTGTVLEAFGIEGPQPVTAEVAVDAESLPKAIATAVSAIESVGVAVTGVGSDDLVSLKDIAARTGRTYESVRLLAAGKRGPGGFPVPYSAGQWSLYSWALVSAWLAEHLGGGSADLYDQEIAAADHIVRARRILAGDANRSAFTALVDA
jgi:hypothetical protein